MAGGKKPTPRCGYGDPEGVEDGTLCRSQSPRPGALGAAVVTYVEGGECLAAAYGKAILLAPTAIYRETGYELGNLLHGMIAGLRPMLLGVGAATLGGAGIGAAAGFFLGGVGAAPGAVVGGELGFDAGMAVLTWLGLGAMLQPIGAGLGEMTAMLTIGVQRAWHAAERYGPGREHEIDAAAHELARAISVLVRLVLEGIVAYLLKNAALASTRGAVGARMAVRTSGTGVVANEAVTAVVAKLRASPLGADFATWVEQSWKDLVKNPRLQPKAPALSGGSGILATEGSAIARTAPTPKPFEKPTGRAKELDALYEKAPAAKKEIDELAADVAKQHGGKVAEAPLKSRARAMQKIDNEYRGDVSRIKDLARNTIIVPAGKETAALESLMKANPNIKPANVKLTDPASDPLGYSGVIVTVPTKSGLPAEIQINTPEMIFAKEKPEVARNILGQETYQRIASQPGLPPGGQGHLLYEEWRSLPADSPKAAEIETRSRAYYDAFRR